MREPARSALPAATSASRAPLRRAFPPSIAVRGRAANPRGSGGQRNACAVTASSATGSPRCASICTTHYAGKGDARYDRRPGPFRAKLQPAEGSRASRSQSGARSPRDTAKDYAARARCACAGQLDQFCYRCHPQKGRSPTQGSPAEQRGRDVQVALRQDVPARIETRIGRGAFPTNREHARRSK